MTQPLDYRNQNSLTAFPFQDSSTRKSVGGFVIPDSWFLNFLFGFKTDDVYSGIYLKQLSQTGGNLTLIFGETDGNTTVLSVTVASTTVTAGDLEIFQNSDCYAKIVFSSTFVGYLAANSTFSHIFTAANTPILSSLVIFKIPKITRLSIDDGDSWINIAPAIELETGANLSIQFNDTTNKLTADVIPGAGTGKYNPCEHVTDKVRSVNGINNGGKLYLNHGECYEISKLDPSAAKSVEDETARLSQGKVFLVKVTDGGSGYTSAPTVVFSSGAAAATAVLVGNQVGYVTVTDGGSGYTTVPDVSFTGGSGTGAEATAYLDLPKVSNLVRQADTGEYYIMTGAGDGDGSSTGDWYNLGTELQGLFVKNLCSPKCQDSQIEAFKAYMNRVADGLIQLGTVANTTQTAITAAYESVCNNPDPYARIKVKRASRTSSETSTAFTELPPADASCYPDNYHYLYYNADCDTLYTYTLFTGESADASAGTIACPYPTVIDAGLTHHWELTGLKILSDTEKFISVSITIYNTSVSPLSVDYSLTVHGGFLYKLEEFYDNLVVPVALTAGTTACPDDVAPAVTGSFTVACNTLGYIKFQAVSFSTADPYVEVELTGIDIYDDSGPGPVTQPAEVPFTTP